MTALPPKQSFCYVTSKGRVTGRPHEIEIWYVEHEGSLYLMAGGGHMADWVKNMKADASVSVRVGDLEFSAVAEVDPDNAYSDAVRRQMAAEYQGWEEGSELSNWARTALLVRVTPAEAI